ncbi:MAG: hypothetical protein HKN85_09955 [Gammaproteobacteria bacterium]|nr:hypothetical protein [Gammaproteobacteria bacterium]
MSKGGKVTIAMHALCQAEKAACDTLIEEFGKINAAIKQRMEGNTAG